jgi:CBS-domain-containing membrane protein
MKRNDDAATHAATQPTGDRLVERMLSGFGHPIARPVARPEAPHAGYAALRQSRAGPGETYRLQAPTTVVRVNADSPATDVMTDLRKVAAVTTRSDATIDEAQQAMIVHGVRALFVVDDERTLLGVITATDLLGERPVQIAHQRVLRHDEIRVRLVMTPAERLEAMELDEVVHARVGDIVASLRLSGRQHALVTEKCDQAGTRMVRGIFSLTQIARQLGLPPQGEHNVARTFAEIEAAIGA